MNEENSPDDQIKYGVLIDDGEEVHDNEADWVKASEGRKPRK